MSEYIERPARDEPAYASASVRNSAAILGVLRYELRDCRRLLEIGSGTGFHAVTFARALPHMSWQTSDVAENHSMIETAVEQSGAENLRPPLLLDVRDAEAGPQAYDAVYSSNTAHIMSFTAVQKMTVLVAESLFDEGLFCLYGPFRRGGVFNTPSNASFDQSLRARDPEMGIRDLEAIDDCLAGLGLRRQRVYAMPANNLLVVWRKTGAEYDDA